MLEKRVLFEDFEFPVVKGLEYLMDEENPTTDYLFINEPSEKFSMYFERGQRSSFCGTIKLFVYE